MEKSNHRLLLALAALLVTLACWLAFQITWKEEVIDTGYSEAAQKDSFLAAKLLLQQQGVEGQTLRSFSILDNLSWQDQALTAKDTLIMLNSHKMLHGERLDNLLAWVEQGGTVIVSTVNPFMGGNTDTRDPLLERFELEVQDAPSTDESEEQENSDTAEESSEQYEDDLEAESTATESDELFSNGDESLSEDKDYSPAENSSRAEETSSAKNEEPDEEVKLPENHDRCNLQLPPLAVDFVNETEPLLIDYSEGQGFDYYGDEPQAAASDEHGLHLAQFELGEGLVIINSDNRIWENERIDCHDHAYALWKLINSNGKVWFLTNQEAPSLWTMLWRATPYGASATLLALALWLWAKAVRFGPILTRANSGRRSLAEHIHASAMLLWRRQEHPYLVTLLRDDLRQHLQQHYPQFEAWSEQEQIAHLQTLTNLNASQLNQALFSDKLHYPQDFTEAVACLQTIRKNV